MAETVIRVLLVEDNPGDARLLRETLRDETTARFELTCAERLDAGLQCLRDRPFDVLLLDLFLPDSHGLETVSRAHERACHVPIIVLTGTDDEATGIEAVRRGAQDYLVKGQVDGRLLVRAIRYSTQRKQVEDALRESQRQLQAANQTLEHRVAERTAEAQRRAEQLRALAAQLTHAEQKERRRLAQILHDHLQQLLVGTKFHLGMVRGQCTDEELRQSLEQIDSLLDQSLETSRSLTADLSPPILHQGNMAQVLRWLADWIAGKHGLKVNVVADEQADPQAQEVRALLFQAVRELLFNVVKHARVDEATVELCRLDDRHVRVVVRDEGAGFDSSRSQIDNSKGSGFGLFNIRERLDWLGGEFRIESSPGAGTCATLVAPVGLASPPASRVGLDAPAGRPGQDATAAAGAPEACGARKIRVLLVDDHAVVRDGLAKLLQALPDMEVVGRASDGQQAVDLAPQLRPDVVIMDVNMPALDGKEATRRILAGLPQVKVIGLSMYAEADVAEAMKAAGAAHYLAKTSGPEALIAAIRGCPARTLP